MLILVAVLFFETEIFITFSLKFFVPSILGFLGLYAFEMLSDDFMKAIASIDLSLISSMFVGMIIVSLIPVVLATLFFAALGGEFNK